MTMRREEYEFGNLFSRFLFDEETDICAIILSGSLDTHSILSLQKEINQIITTGKYNFIVDLSLTTSISSKGLGFLIYLAKYRKNFIFLSYPPKSIIKPFQLLDMKDLFKYYHDIDELKNVDIVPERLILPIQQEKVLIREVKYKMKWKKILRDYLTHEEETKEIEKMAPFLEQADNLDSIILPSEEKYSCIIYRFLNRIFSEAENIDRNEVDDTIVELIAKELMTNAVKHGYDYRKDGVIEANFKSAEDKIEINFIDYGKGFSSEIPSTIPHLSTGLQLLNKIFDAVKISEAPKKKVNGAILGNGTMVKMVKNLNPKEK
jgi:anti-anti-sigma factor